MSMKIYISGAITGLEKSYAEAMFADAEETLAGWGHDPVNPLKNEQPDKTWAEYMAEDIILLDACDAIYMLPNWRQSKGARVEHEIAVVTEKKIFYAPSMELLVA